MADDKFYVSAVKIGLKCACQGCNNPANPGNQVQGSFMPGPDLVSDVDLTHNRLANKVTLYLCNVCFKKVTQGSSIFANGFYSNLCHCPTCKARRKMYGQEPMKPINPENKPEHTEQEVKSLFPGEFFLNKNGSPCTCTNCQDRRKKER